MHSVSQKPLPDRECNTAVVLTGALENGDALERNTWHRLSSRCSLQPASQSCTTQIYQLGIEQTADCRRLTAAVTQSLRISLLVLHRCRFEGSVILAKSCCCMRKE